MFYRWLSLYIFIMCSKLRTFAALAVQAIQCRTEELGEETCLRFQQRSDTQDYLNFVQGSGDKNAIFPVIK